MVNQAFPSEVVDLPSHGWFYDPASPLASGKVEMKYLTAREEDILTSRNLITKGVVLEKLLEALVVNKDIKMDDLLVSDWDGLMVAGRIMGYGKDYAITVSCATCGAKNDQTVDLVQLDEKKVPEPTTKGTNRFQFTLPHSKKVVTYRLLTHGVEQAVNAELVGMQKATQSDIDATLSTRLKYMLVAVDGNESTEVVRSFVDNQFLARDSRAFRDEYTRNNPGLDLRFDFKCQKCGAGRRMALPIGLDFFWPESGV